MIAVDASSPSFPFAPRRGDRLCLGRSLVDTTDVLQVLCERGVKVDYWPDGQEGLSGLVDELTTGRSELRWSPSERRLFRKLRLVRMHLRAKFDGVDHYLFEEKQICLEENQVRRRWKGKLPSETLEQGESPLEGFRRGLMEELHMRPAEARRIRILHQAWRPMVEIGQGRSFPGLETHYYIWDFYANVPPKFARREGYVEDHDDRRTILVWHPDIPADDIAAL